MTVNLGLSTPFGIVHPYLVTVRWELITNNPAPPITFRNLPAGLFLVCA